VRIYGIREVSDGGEESLVRVHVDADSNLLNKCAR
jgi:hypothetical protein